jgi:hypothetical protein
MTVPAEPRLGRPPGPLFPFSFSPGFFPALFLLLSSLFPLLLGCFDLSEELDLSADGSGRVRIVVTLPVASLRHLAPPGRRWTEEELLAELDRRMAGEGRTSARVRVERAEVRREGRLVMLHFEGRFDSLDALKRGPSRPTYDGTRLPALSIDTFLFPREATLSGRWTFEQALGEDFPVVLAGQWNDLVMREVESQRWRFFVHLPAPVAETDGTAQGPTAFWAASPREIAAGLRMRAVAKERSGWGFALWGALFAVVLVTAIFAVARRSRTAVTPPGSSGASSPPSA